MDEADFEAFLAGRGPLAEALRRLPRAAVPPSLDDWMALWTQAEPGLQDLRYSAPPALAARVLARAAELEAARPHAAGATAAHEPEPALPSKYYALGRPARRSRYPASWAYGLAASVLVGVVGVQIATLHGTGASLRAPSTVSATASSDARIVPIEVIRPQPSKREGLVAKSAPPAAAAPAAPLEPPAETLPLALAAEETQVQSGRASAAAPQPERAPTTTQETANRVLLDQATEELSRSVEAEPGGLALMAEVPAAPTAATAPVLAERGALAASQTLGKLQEAPADDTPVAERLPPWLGPFPPCPSAPVAPREAAQPGAPAAGSNTDATAGGLGTLERLATPPLAWQLQPAARGLPPRCIVDTQGLLAPAFGANRSLEVRWRETPRGIELQALSP